jgi:hypothetical protein
LSTRRAGARAPARHIVSSRAQRWKEAMAKNAKQDAKKPLVITLSGDRAIHDVANDLRAAGLHVDQVLEAIGSVTGSADPEHVERLRKVKGVADVSHDHSIDIGPPGSIS